MSGSGSLIFCIAMAVFFFSSLLFDAMFLPDPETYTIFEILQVVFSFFSEIFSNADSQFATY